MELPKRACVLGSGHDKIFKMLIMTSAQHDLRWAGLTGLRGFCFLSRVQILGRINGRLKENSVFWVKRSLTQCAGASEDGPLRLLIFLYLPFFPLPEPARESSSCWWTEQVNRTFFLHDPEPGIEGRTFNIKHGRFLGFFIHGCWCFFSTPYLTEENIWDGEYTSPYLLHPSFMWKMDNALGESCYD